MIHRAATFSGMNWRCLKIPVGCDRLEQKRPRCRSASGDYLDTAMHDSIGSPGFQRHRHRSTWICLLLCLVFVVADRGLILSEFGFRYVDDDQTIMWYGANEMAAGRFHEPSFYGQRYNTMLEGALAVPFLKAGMRPNVALPVVSSILAVFPFVLLAMLLAWQGSFVLAAFTLAFPVTLSPEFGMMSAMPRGFVTGVFLGAFAVLPLFSRRSIFLLRRYAGTIFSSWTTSTRSYGARDSLCRWSSLY
jgi:hypothetical protein